MVTGTVSRPRCWQARNRLSPAMSSSRGVTTIGCSNPISRIRRGEGFNVAKFAAMPLADDDVRDRNLDGRPARIP